MFPFERMSRVVRGVSKQTEGDGTSDRNMGTSFYAVGFQTSPVQRVVIAHVEGGTGVFEDAYGQR
jgi:hypothetical protein